MALKFVNDWLGDVVGSDMPLVDMVYAKPPRDWMRAVQSIRDFRGAKVMVSCTDRTPLLKVLKQALCFADLVILVPAPLWVSCTSPNAHRYAEFNYESVGLGGSCHISVGLLQNLSNLISEETLVFANGGAATFLPVLGESQLRWFRPELGLPELPGPDIGHGRQDTPLSIHVDALYGLCSERLAAERLGAMHLNAASFTKPVLGDLTLGQQQTGDWVHYLWEISIPDLSVLSVSDVVHIRRELPQTASQFSRATRRALSSDDADGHIPKATVEELQNSAATLAEEIESRFGMKNSLPKTTVVLGSGGQHGGISSTVDFLVSGGTPMDLARLITASGEKKLKLSPDSFWAASY